MDLQVFGATEHSPSIDHRKVKESDPQILLAQIDYEEVISTIWSVCLSAVSES